MGSGEVGSGPGSRKRIREVGSEIGKWEEGKWEEDTGSGKRNWEVGRGTGNWELEWEVGSETRSGKWK